MPAQTKKWFPVRFDANTDRNLREDKKKKERCSLHFDLTFVGIFGGDLLKPKKINLVTCKISLLIYLETTCGSQYFIMRLAKLDMGSSVLNVLLKVSFHV